MTSPNSNLRVAWLRLLLWYSNLLASPSPAVSGFCVISCAAFPTMGFIEIIILIRTEMSHNLRLRDFTLFSGWWWFCFSVVSDSRILVQVISMPKQFFGWALRQQFKAYILYEPSIIFKIMYRAPHPPMPPFAYLDNTSKHHKTGCSATYDRIKAVSAEVS